MPGPAARLGDSTAHGGTLVLGAPTVLIGGMPASRVTDMHVCPASNGPVPHVGGPVVMGVATVLTVSMPQATIGSNCVCVGPLAAVVSGCTTVLVGTGGGAGGGAGGGNGMGGAAGAAAGAAMSGVRPAPAANPATQSLGDGRYLTDAGAVRVEADLTTTAALLRALASVRGRETGRAVLGELAGAGRAVMLRDGREATVRRLGDAVDVTLPVGALRDVVRVEGDGHALERCLWVALDLGADARVTLDVTAEVGACG